jgi:hypothetical protein
MAALKRSLAEAQAPAGRKKKSPDRRQQALAAAGARRPRGSGETQPPGARSGEPAPIERSGAVPDTMPAVRSTLRPDPLLVSARWPAA